MFYRIFLLDNRKFFEWIKDSELQCQIINLQTLDMTDLRELPTIPFYSYNYDAAQYDFVVYSFNNSSSLVVYPITKENAVLLAMQLSEVNNSFVDIPFGWMA